MAFNQKSSLALFLGLFILLSAVLTWSFFYQGRTHFMAGTNPILEEKPAPPPAPVLPQIRPTDPARGSADKNAVVIVEFGDYLSSQSRTLELSLRQVLNEQRIPVRLIWRDLFPPSEDPGYMLAAQSVRCAGEQGKFWEMHDAVLTAPAIDVRTMEDAASKLHLDTGTYRQCLESGKYMRDLANDIDAERSAHIIENPTIFVGQKSATGIVTPEQLTTLIWTAQRGAK